MSGEVMVYENYFVTRDGRVFSCVGWRGCAVREMVQAPNKTGYASVAANCSGIALCGDRISSGMQDEIAAYRLRRGLIADLGIADLTGLEATEWPPAATGESLLAFGRKRWAQRENGGIRV